MEKVVIVAAILLSTLKCTTAVNTNWYNFSMHNFTMILEVTILSHSGTKKTGAEATSSIWMTENVSNYFLKNSTEIGNVMCPHEPRQALDSQKTLLWIKSKLMLTLWVI